MAQRRKKAIFTCGRSVISSSINLRCAIHASLVLRVCASVALRGEISMTRKLNLGAYKSVDGTLSDSKLQCKL